MKILMLDPANLTPFYTYALSNGLVNAGHDLTFYSTRYDNDLTLVPPANIGFTDHYFKGLRHLQLNGSSRVRKLVRGLHYLPNHFRLFNIIKKQKPDVVHIQWALLPNLDLWLIKRVQELGIKVVMTVHDVNPLFDFGGDKALIRLYKQVDTLIVHHEGAISVLRDRFKINNLDKVQVIPHGPLQSENIPATASRDAARESLNIPKDAHVVSFFGEIKHYKGLDILIDAVIEASKEDERIYLLMAGRPGSPSDIPNLEVLDQANVNYSHNFSFIPNDDVWKYYLAANVVALPYREISQSGVLFTALAHERFVLCSKVGGLPELLQQVGGGTTVEKENVTALSTALIELMKRAKELDLEAEKAKKELFNEFSWDVIAQKTTKAYLS